MSALESFKTELKTSQTAFHTELKDDYIETKTAITNTNVQNFLTLSALFLAVAVPLSGLALKLHTDKTNKKLADSIKAMKKEHAKSLGSSPIDYGARRGERRVFLSRFYVSLVLCCAALAL